MESIQKLLCEMQVEFILKKYTDKRTKRPHRSKPFKCNWIADYAIIMLVDKITWILKITSGLLANQNADSEYNVCNNMWPLTRKRSNVSRSNGQRYRSNGMSYPFEKIIIIN